MSTFLNAERWRSYTSLLHNRDFRLWFLSGLGSSLGDWVGLFALQVLVISLADEGTQLALFGLGGIMMARLLPSVLFGPIAGVVADRYDRKRLMVIADIVRAALFVGIAFSREIWLIFALTFVVECLSLAYLSAKNASLPALVKREDLTAANQLQLLITYGPLPFGAGVATGMSWFVGRLSEWGIEVGNATLLALLLNAATFLVAGLLLAPLRLSAAGRGKDEGPTPGPVQQLRDGFAFIRDRRYVRSLIVGVVGVFFGAGAVITLGPEFVRTVLGRPEEDWYGLMTMVGSGLLAGIVAVPLVTARLSKDVMFPITLVLAAVIAVVTGLTTSFAWVQAVGVVLGALAGFSFVTGFTLLHERTDDMMRARTFAAFYTGTRIAMFAALAFAPFLAGALGSIGLGPFRLSGIRVTLVAGGFVALCSATVAAVGMLRATNAERADAPPD